VSIKPRQALRYGALGRAVPRAYCRPEAHANESRGPEKSSVVFIESRVNVFSFAAFAKWQDGDGDLG